MLFIFIFDFFFFKQKTAYEMRISDWSSDVCSSDLLRGKVRLRLGRQLTDHSSVLAPLNVLLCAASPLPVKPFLPRDRFPALDSLRDNWKTIRDEALALADSGGIRTATGYNDVGFNSFFRWGWKRFYLQWYDDAPHPSALHTCPKTLALLQAIPSVKAAMRSEEHTSELQSLMRTPYAVFC